MLITSREEKNLNKKGESVKKWIQNGGNIKHLNYPDNLVVDVEGLATKEA